MKQIIDTQLPLFCGFYGTYLDIDIDDQTLEDLNVDYDHYQKDVSLWFVSKIEKMINTDLGIDCKLVFEKLNSPKYYNYTNDEIYIQAIFKSKKEFLKIKDLIYENFDYIRDYIKDSCTSREGFFSYYSSDIYFWETKTNKFKDFDNIELELILEALLNLTFDQESFMYEFYESGHRLDSYILNESELMS